MKWKLGKPRQPVQNQHCANCIGTFVPSPSGVTIIFAPPATFATGPSGVDPGEGRGGRLPPAPIKIYLGESVFSPPQSFSLCISYTPGTTLRGQKDTQNESRGDGDSETVDERDM